MRRRDFIALLGGALAAWPRTAGAQNVTRRIGILDTAGNEQTTTRLFVETLGKLGWIDGRNVHIDNRTSNASPESVRMAAAELVALRPDVIFAPGASMSLKCRPLKPSMTCQRACGRPWVGSQAVSPCDAGRISW